MKAQQKKRIVSRVNEFKWNAKQVLDDEYNKMYNKSIQEERKNKVLQIMNGTAKIKKKISFEAALIEQVFNFKNLSKEDERDKMHKIKQNKMDDMYDMAEKVVDEIILTDGKNAIKLLQDFEVYCKNMKLSK